MSQTRRAIEQLIEQHKLPLKHAEAAAKHLEVYPSKSTWLSFFDKALLIIGALALVLSLVFFIAYNWQNLGKLGKFALVEGALVITIALYVGLSFRRRFHFIRQLLLLVASIITGSLLALFGQVYQTGADTWQLFFAWAVLITPWVIIARFPALWLLWLGLLNTFLLLYLEVVDLSFVDSSYQDVIKVAILALINLVALNLWLIFLGQKRAMASQVNSEIVGSDTSIASPNLSSSKTTYDDILLQAQAGLHWSTYLVGLISTIAITFLAIITVFDVDSVLATLLSLSLWAGWCAFMYWRFYRQRSDLLMLTYLCFSLIIVVMSWAVNILPSDFDTGSLLVLTLLLIGMVTYAIKWLFEVIKSDNSPSEDLKILQAVNTPLNKKGADHE